MENHSIWLWTGVIAWILIFGASIWREHMSKNKKKKKSKVFIIFESKDYKKYKRICESVGIIEIMSQEEYKELAKMRPKGEE